MPTGSYSFDDLLVNRFQTVGEFGLDTIQPVLAAELAAHNAVMEEMLAGLAETTSDVERIYGSAVGGQMLDADEFAVGQTQKVAPGAEVAFPLKKKIFDLGWTNEYFLKATVADMAIMQQNAQIAHRQEVIKEMRRAIYGSSNFSFRDRFGRVKKTLTIKRFLNADGDPIPAGPNGEVYDGATETHYTAEASLTAAGLTAAVDNVALKASDASEVKIAINKANEAAVKGLAGFEAYVDQRLLIGPDNNDPRQLVISTPTNRPIGLFAGAEVWVKPWAEAGYAFVFDMGAPEKPLVHRVDDSAALRGLYIAAELPDHPLYAETMEARFGFGVYNRRAGALHYFAGGSYADPSFV
ncbi:MAG: hypothetical protein AAFU38_10100 [Bacteroidota bacterium]